MKTVAKPKVASKNTQVSKVKRPTHFNLRILSRHPSTRELRNKILIKGARVVYRHGSTTEGDFEYEINSTGAIKTSADKLLMKQAFDKAEVNHAVWLYLPDVNDKVKYTEFIKKSGFGKDKDSWTIIKQRWGSRGMGNYLIKSQAELDKFMKEKNKSLNNYIIEDYKKYSVEYRIHATEHGYFYACRKMLKKDTPKNERFQRHDDNCSWFVETNPQFNKPANWNEIVKQCVSIVKVMEADVLAFDIKCTSVKESKDKNCKWIIIESCSAPSFGKITLQKYMEELPKIVKSKYDI